jgi:hypothetical protein
MRLPLVVLVLKSSIIGSTHRMHLSSAFNNQYHSFAMLLLFAEFRISRSRLPLYGELRPEHRDKRSQRRNICSPPKHWILTFAGLAIV